MIALTYINKRARKDDICMYKIIKYKDIKPIYEINTKGEIRNTITGRKISSFITTRGYLDAILYTNDGKRKHVLVHRMVFWTFNDVDEEYFDSHVVNHKDCDKLNNDINNLELVTQSYNSQHAAENDRYECLENRYNSNLTNEQVHMICKGISEGKTYQEIFNMVKNPNLTNDVYKKIKTRKNYTRISSQYDFTEEVDIKHSKLLKEKIAILCIIGFSNKEIYRMLELEKCSSYDYLFKRVRVNIKRGMFNDYRNGYVRKIIVTYPE